MAVAPGPRELRRRRPCWSCSTAGDSRRTARATRHARARRRCSTSSGDVSAHAAHRLRPRRRAPRRADGQLRGRPHEPRRRRGRDAGPDPDRRGGRVERELASNEVLRAAFTGAERVHLIGLVSDGGVHSSIEHLQALIGLGAEFGVADLVMHAFTDGRDTLPHGRRRLPRDRAGVDRDAGAGRIGTVVGRYYAMDRDRRWDRVAARLRPARSRARRAPRLVRGAGGPRRVRARRDRRVHHAGARRGPRR